MAKNFIFGYGSLISEESRKKTGITGKSIPAKLFGYRREWNTQIPKEKATFLGLIKNKKNFCNGIIFEVFKKTLKKFDKREGSYYKRIEVNSSKIKILPKNKLGNKQIVKIWVYLTKKPKKPTKNFPILLSYLEIVIKGCLNFGKEFFKEFFKTTYKWGYLEDDSNNPKYVRAEKKLLNNQEFNKLKGGES